ncbi:protein-L-isoaspartate O-methyltransferase [Candidatus Saccharibacteria bacterium]|nr:protein-L-isoaspartate O-methyltransferase [Candidatus Saccharibacteria bacterium]
MDRIGQAFTKFDRVNFIPNEAKPMAQVDAPVPIGYGQTNSQPTTVEMMLEWLDVQPGDKVLDVGSGSGWTTALLSYLAGPKGEIYAVELVPELVEFGRENAERAGVKNAKFYQAGDQFGLPERAPFDRILVSASADKLPQVLIDQLKPGGKLVVPVHNDILEVIKDTNGKTHTKTHPGFVFVPLI